jgi:hypothetical protein
MTYLYEALKKPTRIYHKQCSHCGLNYLGKSVSNDIKSYSGSGTVWQRHLKKHKATAIHIWNSDWFFDTSIVKYALDLSGKLNIVESDKWANLKPENGQDGGDTSPFIDYSKCNTPAAIEKRKITTNSEEWLQTIGLKKSNTIKEKYKARQESDEWVTNVLGPSKIKQSSTMSLIRKETPYKSIQCEKCGVVSDPGNYTKWHGKNCGKIAEVICPHCLKKGSGGVMNRWHFDNCKLKT